jgi:multidrug efflux pump subunit AcrA (membrane-fusion protein)
MQMPTAETSAAADSLAQGISIKVRSLEAGTNLPVRASAMGIVRQVFFEEGQRVRPGQILLKLDSDWNLPRGSWRGALWWHPRTARWWANM